ncbi:MAG: CRTAC1 family protein [Verrucomicrobia bacterium]|nr:CRTAC1 family protein [Verrucomicrobiota bacterium]
MSRNAWLKPATAVLLFVAATFVLLNWFRDRPVSSPFPMDRTLGNTNRISPELAAQVSALEAREQNVNETAWKQEMLAQECGGVFEALWDSVNAATNKLNVIAAFPVGQVLLGNWESRVFLPHGIQIREPKSVGAVLSMVEWQNLVEGFDRAGWQLVQVEFRHNRFETDEGGSPSQSSFYFSAHLNHPDNLERVVLEGNLVVEWAAAGLAEAPWEIERIDASNLEIKTRRGAPPFQLILSEAISPPANSYSIDPLILYDLDGDGLSEIILAAKNVVYRGRGDGRYDVQALCEPAPDTIFAAVIADFNGDGNPDFLAETVQGLVLFESLANGVFGKPRELAGPAVRQVDYAMVITCGDIDQDGDLDVFLGQYKIPYKDGQLPTPFHDANDGYPAYLLLNDGLGNFSDVTELSGLAKKRFRRCYSASFADLNSDGHLDLMVVSDFAGVDLYRNDGRGRFTDVTSQWIADSHAFGMAHTLADFDSDGRLDFLMIGMTSPAADRLGHSGLGRLDATIDPLMRARMTYGNRLYFSASESKFEQTAMSETIARSGWSWGCGALDFDNDGFPDVYVANGLESRQSVRDYEAEYWLHDVYVGGSTNSSAAYLYFGSKFARTRGRGHSYGGYEKNRFFLNRNGTSFIEVGHLMGVALEEDSRNVVADDLDGDGRVDLLVTSFETWPESRQTLRVYRNTTTDPGHWIGFRFRERDDHGSPVGVNVTLRYGRGSQVRQVVTGDSYRSQHAPTLHFGLGEYDAVGSAEVVWPDGRTVRLDAPAVDRYHSVPTRRVEGKNE